MNRLPAHECVPVVQCRATSRTGKQCKNKAIPGGTVCRFHGGASPHVASEAVVRAEVWSWGLGDATVDPGEVLLRLVTQSAGRAERYAMLLEEAYEAAERLKQAHDAGMEIEAPGEELADTAETARRDLDRTFNTGGVAALVGNTYGAAKDVGVYVTGEVPHTSTRRHGLHHQLTLSFGHSYGALSESSSRLGREVRVLVRA